MGRGNKVLGLATLALVLVVYQFGKNEFLESNPGDNGVALEASSTIAPFSISTAKPSQAKFLTILNARNTLAMAGRKLTGKKTYYYRIELATGKIEAQDYLEKPIEDVTACMSKSSWDSLKQILADAEICESPAVEDQGRTVHCEMSYTLPFAILEIQPDLKFSLGEKNTVCDYPTALCGESQQKLLNWIRGVLPQINAKSECERP